MLLLEADREFSACGSELLEMVDNYAILSLDIAWCYLSVHAVSELPDAEQKLARCEEKFKSSYGRNMERVAALKGSQSNELALMARLHLLQGVVAFHLGRDREARLQLEKVSTEMQLLSVDEMELMEIVSMGYTLHSRRGRAGSEGLPWRQEAGRGPHHQEEGGEGGDPEEGEGGERAREVEGEAGAVW